MPLNFAEVWLNRVIKNITTADQAPWLDGISELDAPVIEVGSGDASESNIIHIPMSFFEPDVLINNTTYPIALQAYTDTEATLQLDKYQTKVTTLSDDQIIGAAYNRIDAATSSHTLAIVKKKFSKALHALAPAGNTANTPVLVTTGELVNGRRRMVYADLVSLKAALDAIDTPMQGRRLVLCQDHWNDMLLDRGAFGDQIVNYKPGTLAPMIAGFELYNYIVPPYYTVSTKVKNAYGAANSGVMSPASVVFYTPNVAKKTGMTKQYFAPASQDPENQTNKLNYRHYYLVLPIQNKYVGAMISALS